MIIPLNNLISYQGNVYEVTNACIRRALQISVTGDEELDENNRKIISTAIKQVLTKKVEYTIED
jgi:DNA-directed RNA polymerase subunit omega